MTVAGKSQKQEIPLRLTFVRPNRLDFDAGTVRLTSDGSTMTTVAIPLKRYATEPAPPRIGFELFREGPLGAVLFGGAAGAPLHVLLNLLTVPDPATAIAGLGGSLQLAPGAPEHRDSSGSDRSTPRNGRLLLDMRDGPDMMLVIDPATRLLSAIELIVDPERLALADPAGEKLAIERFGWLSGTISTRVAPDRSFTFSAPSGFTKVDSIFGRASQRAGDEQVGKPAPEFTLTVLDGPGKTKTLTKADLSGMVVVLDFWATWCQPCLMELPELQKLIESCAGSKKNVLIVAVSQDSEPTEIAEVRKRVEKTLDEKKLRIGAHPVGRIALDPSNSIGRAFEITGYPTLVIIDPRGIIRTVHIGFDPSASEPLHQVLLREVEALLAGGAPRAPRPGERTGARTPARAPNNSPRTAQ
jgi:thiol-disulfide isomerase/thioredoxin